MNISETTKTSFFWTKQIITLIYYLLAFYGFIIIIFWLLNDDPVIQLPVGSVEPTKTIPGSVVVFKQPIQKLRDCPGEVQRFISGSCGLKHIPTEATTLTVGNHILTIPVDIPLSFQPGECEFVSKFRYFCDPLDFVIPRKMYSSFPIQFTVEKK